MPVAIDSETIGEVIESSSSAFRAACRSLDDPPPFGGFVRVRALNALPGAEETDPFDTTPLVPPGTVYGIVHDVVTGSSDSGRRSAAYWRHEQDLRREQPQIFELLVTEFACLIVGHGDTGTLRAGFPSKPPRIHSFVEECAESEVRALTERPDFLRAILTSAVHPFPDELMVAALRNAWRSRGRDEAWLVESARHLSRLLGDDYERFSDILRRVAE